MTIASGYEHGKKADRDHHDTGWICNHPDCEEGQHPWNEAPQKCQSFRDQEIKKGKDQDQLVKETFQKIVTSIPESFQISGKNVYFSESDLTFRDDSYREIGFFSKKTIRKDLNWDYVSYLEKEMVKPARFHE